MKKINKQKIAEIYANALLNAEKSAEEAKILLKQTQKLQDFLQKSNKTIEYFSSPLISMSDKKNMMDMFCKEQKFLPIMQNFLQILLENNRFSQISAIMDEFTKIYMENCGFVYVTVQS